MSKGSCSFCGEHFDNVFEAADHLNEGFDPEFIVSNRVRFGMGEMFYKVYQDGNAELKEWAEEMFSALYIAEKRPEDFEHFLFEHTGSLTRLVYAIVSADSWKKLEEDVKTPPTRSFPTIPAGRGRFA